jgi:hypothetical protein
LKFRDVIESVTLEDVFDDIIDSELLSKKLKTGLTDLDKLLDGGVRDNGYAFGFIF